MPKRELSKCREWERERRDRLKTCFTALSKLLPCHEPSVVLSKLEILQRAAAYIEELQRKSKDLLLGDDKAAKAEQEEIKRLHERVKKLVTRNEQLARLLQDAGIKIPKECGTVRQFREPLLWSHKIPAEKADALLKKYEQQQNSNLENKKKRKPSPRKKCDNVTDKVGGVKKTVRLKKRTKRLKNAVAAGVKEARAPLPATVLGPGTLILANGNIVPMWTAAQQVQTILTPANGPIISRPTAPTVNSSTVIVMQQQKCNDNSNSNNCSKNSGKSLPVLKPKLNGMKTPNVVHKVPIPPLRARNSLQTKNRVKRKVKKIAAKKSVQPTTTVKDTVAKVTVASDNKITSGSETPTENKAKEAIKERTASTNASASYTIDSLCGDAVPEDKSTVQEVSKAVSTETCKPEKTSETAISEMLNKGDSTVVNTDLSVQQDKQEKCTDIQQPEQQPQDQQQTQIPPQKVQHQQNQLQQVNEQQKIQQQQSQLQQVPQQQHQQQNQLQQVQQQQQNQLQQVQHPQQKVQQHEQHSQQISVKEADSSVVSWESSAASVGAGVAPVGNTDAADVSKALSLALPHSELSNDIFASLPGAGPSMSPTAAFLLAFPLVSSLTCGKVTEVLVEDAPDSRQGTPTTLLQIGGTMDTGNGSKPAAVATTNASNLLNIDNFTNFSFTTKDNIFYSRDTKPLDMDAKPAKSNKQQTKSCAYSDLFSYDATANAGDNTGKRQSHLPKAQCNAYNPFADLHTAREQSTYSCSNYSYSSSSSSYHQGNMSHSRYQSTNTKTIRHKEAQQQQQAVPRAPVNWMTAPDVRPPHPPPPPTGDFILPPFSKELDFGQNTLFGGAIYTENTSDKQPAGGYVEHDNQFSWSPSKLPPLLDTHHALGTLPTLVGDLALAQPPPPPPPQHPIKHNRKISTTVTYDTLPPSSTFLSVSQLVEPTNASGGGGGGGSGATRRRSGGATRPHKRPKDTNASVPSKSHKTDANATRTSYKTHLPSSNYSAEALISGSASDTHAHSHHKHQHLAHNKQQLQMAPFPPSDSIVPYFGCHDPATQYHTLGTGDANQAHQHQQTQPHDHHQHQQHHQQQQQTFTSSASYMPPPPPPPPTTNDFSPTFDSFQHASANYATNTTHTSAAPYPTMSTKQHVKAASDISKGSCSRRAYSKRSKHVAASSTAPAAPNGAGPDAIHSYMDMSSFLTMPSAASSAVNSPLLPEDFHSTFLPAPPPPTTSSLTNFNLTTIFPEMNNKLVPPPPPRLYNDNVRTVKTSMHQEFSGSGQIHAHAHSRPVTFPQMQPFTNKASFPAVTSFSNFVSPPGHAPL